MAVCWNKWSPRTLRYLVAALGLFVALFALIARADARNPCWRGRTALPPAYSFSVEDEQGGPLPTFVQDGRTYLLGEPGLRYVIRVKNPTARRVEAVVSVDGRDAVSGQPGDYLGERGYIIEAGSSVVVEGFRRSLEEVAAFRFTSPGESYSARLGTPQNVGVIGVAFFPERLRLPAPIVRRALPRPSAAPEGPRARDAAKAGADDDRMERADMNHLGTEFGESRESRVNSMPFERAATLPAVVRTLRYDDVDGLSARGIDVSAYDYDRPVPNAPEPFPGSRFAQPPPVR